ncbi:hypothetical protein L0G78_31990 [Pseudomonas aeruginosa]|nr:HD domain-containing phosphohydrolase [Pseudomonas aeruginosa]MCF1759684.1 hypothetical protein [Pseudomonas aeruginosa]
MLNKPGKLSDAEFTLMKQHPEAGARLLRLGGAAPQVHDVALLHHEKVDGSGYPQGLVGENIPLLARMGAICDVYDAVTSERPYKKAWEPAIAIRHTPYAIRQMATWDGHFDKAIFNAFVKCVGIYPVGSLVQLESRQLAVVVEPGSRSLLTPVVKVFYSLRSKAHIPVQSIDLASAHCQDRIVGPEDPEQWNFTRLTDFWLI